MTPSHLFPPSVQEFALGESAVAAYKKTAWSAFPWLIGSLTMSPALHSCEQCTLSLTLIRMTKDEKGLAFSKAYCSKMS
jgi:hypothetical protein